MSKVIGGISTELNTKKVGKLEITTLADGSMLKIPFHVITGSRPGPTLLLISTMVGLEWPSIEYVHKALQETENEDFAGTLVVVPVANPLAYQSGARDIPFIMRNRALNESFPGSPNGLLGQRMAHELTEKIVKNVDGIIYLTTTFKRMATESVTILNNLSGDLSERTLEMAEAFGLEAIHSRPLIPQREGSVNAYAAELGIPVIQPESGNPEFGFSGAREFFLEKNVTGIRNVMKHFGMLEGAIVEPRKQALVTQMTPMLSKYGGYFYPEIGLDRLAGIVKKGELLGKTICPYTFEELERFEAPFDSVCMMMRSSGPIQPGDDAYEFADLENLTWLKEP